jgi:hypothetical protein
MSEGGNFNNSEYLFMKSLDGFKSKILSDENSDLNKK